MLVLGGEECGSNRESRGIKFPRETVDLIDWIHELRVTTEGTVGDLPAITAPLVLETPRELRRALLLKSFR